MLPRLRSSANLAMWKAWYGAGLHRGTAKEVACVKNLIQVALPEVEAAWYRHLQKAGISATLQGAVCHGHPWVRYSGAAARCELGDFLLVHDHRPDPASLQRRAVLVQAKVFHLKGVRARNPIQLNLYRRWPRFTYESWPGGLGNLDSVHAKAGLKDPLPIRRERELAIAGGRHRLPASSTMLDDGCRYGMIDVEYSRWGDPLKGMNPWRLCSARAVDVYASRDGLTLGSYLVRLMAGEVGRYVPVTQWPASMSVACHWSLMVMELLSILPGVPVSASGNIAFVAVTPNILSGQLKSTAISEYEGEEGSFGIIRVETSGDLGDVPRSEVELRD
jgi:hypothetical protein